MQVDVLGAARHCSSPVLFGHAKDDQLVLAAHTTVLYEHYGGEKVRASEYIHVYVYAYIHINICIYMYGERARESVRERQDRKSREIEKVAHRLGFSGGPVCLRLAADVES